MSYEHKAAHFTQKKGGLATAFQVLIHLYLPIQVQR